MLKSNKVIEYGFYFFIFFLPWQTRLIWRDFLINGFTWEYGRLSIYATEVLLLVLLILYTYWLLKNHKLRQISLNNFWTNLQKPENLVYWLAVVFVLWCGWSIFWAADTELAYYTWLKILSAAAVFSALLIFPINWDKLAIFWVSAAVVQSLFAIWQFFVQYIFASKYLGLAFHLPIIGGATILQTSTARWLRAYGSLPHPNVLGGFLVIALLFILYLAFKDQSRFRRIFVASSLVAIVPALFFSFSRSAWIGLIVALGVIGIWILLKAERYDKKYFFKIVFLALMIASVLTTNLAEEVWTRLVGIEPLEVNSIELRFTFTEQAIYLIKNNLISGVGLGNYTWAIYQQLNNTWPGYYYQPVHNIFLLIFAETGLVGILIFFTLLLTLTLSLIRKLDSWETAVAFSMLLGVLVICLFDHYFWSLYFGVVSFWVVLAFAAKQLKN